VLASADEKPGTVLCELSLAQVAERRRNMPLAAQRRSDLYSLLDLTA
jgi:predicted amidohydrolase